MIKLWGLVAVSICVAGCGSSSPSTGETVTSSTYCTKVADAGSATSLNYAYQVVTYASGDKRVDCSVGPASAQYSSGELYRASQSGATTGVCLVNFSLSGLGSYGYWTFTPSKTVYTAVGNPHDGYSYTFAAGECTTL